MFEISLCLCLIPPVWQQSPWRCLQHPMGDRTRWGGSLLALPPMGFTGFCLCLEPRVPAVDSEGLQGKGDAGRGGVGDLRLSLQPSRPLLSHPPWGSALFWSTVGSTLALPRVGGRSAEGPNEVP